jgi:diketogulonate reductase-like aldo/keto reductase
LGQAIRDTGVNRAGLFITTKVDPAHLDYSGVTRAVDASLRRLDLPYLDLYLIHWPGPKMRLAETFRALNEAVRAGRV